MAKRYEDEIEEILDRSGGLRIVPPQRQSLSLVGLLTRYMSQRLRGLWALSPGRVMLAGVLLIAAGFLLRIADAELAVPIAIAGIVALLAGYALAVVRPAARSLGKADGPPTNAGKTWRGRPIDADPEDNWWTRQGRGPK